MAVFKASFQTESLCFPFSSLLLSSIYILKIKGRLHAGNSNDIEKQSLSS